MRLPILILLFVCALTRPLPAQEAGGDLGVGFIAGTPFGFSAKYLVSRNGAVDAALGVNDGDFTAHVDVMTHLRDLRRQPPKGKLAPYLGLGMKLKDEKELLFGFRFLGGLSYVVEGLPLEFFAELAPVLRAAPSADSGIDGGVGLRYYFGATAKKAKKIR